MTVAQRIASIRLMEKMENQAKRQDNDRFIKEEDGTLKWLGKNGEVLVEAKMKGL